MIRALTLDLDDTLWPVAPAIIRAEQALDAYLRVHCPDTARRYPVPAMRALRDRIAEQHPQLGHDFTAQRKLSLATALEECGDDPRHVDAAFEAFYDARNQVELYADALQALQVLASHHPLAALTNGNADLQRIGLAGHFRFCLGAREHGAGKPDPGIFLAACRRLGEPADAVLHVGDDPHLDVAGAARAGMPSCWINRHGSPWPAELARPDLEVADLGELLRHLGLPAAPSGAPNPVSAWTSA